MTMIRNTAAWIAVLALALLGLSPVPQAQAAARVTVSSSLGGTTMSADGSTDIKVSGSGFQSIDGGFGGIYVLFGWVDDPDGGSWRPSEGGKAGSHYLYVPDSESKNNQGFQRFVTFPGSSTKDAANGGELAADGSWSLTMRVPGPTFTAKDRDGNSQDVDCRKVTCGVITIGAHGVVNNQNETFTPVSFDGGSSGSGGGSSSANESTESDSDTASESGNRADSSDGDTDEESNESDSEESADSDSGEQEETRQNTGPATVGVQQSTVAVGRVVAFTGQGFVPGEQVVASLSGGIAAVGPLTVGANGEVAGALGLPADIRPGSHVLTVVGAASGEAPEVGLTLVADPETAAAEATAAEEMSQYRIPLLIVGGLALLLVLLLISSAITALVQRRARKRGATSARGGKGGRGRQPRPGNRRSTHAEPGAARAQRAANNQAAPASPTPGTQGATDASGNGARWQRPPGDDAPTTLQPATPPAGQDNEPRVGV